MPQIYETTPTFPIPNIISNPVYISPDEVDQTWGTILPQFIRFDLKSGSLYTVNPIEEANQAANYLANLNPIQAVENYLEQNQLNYIVGGIGLVLIAAAVFQIVKPL